MSSTHELMVSLFGEDAAAVVACKQRIASAHEAIRPLVVLERWEDVKAMADLIAQNAETLATAKRAGVID